MRIFDSCLLRVRFRHAAGLLSGALLLAAPGCSGKGPSIKPAGAARPGASAGPRFVRAVTHLDYRWTAPSRRPLTILETIGNGCAMLDYDGDGNLDLLLVGPRLALYRGDGKGGFANVSGSTGVGAVSGRFLGCAVGDIDNDGYPDLYVSGYHAGALLRNDAGRRFVDITAASGVPAQPWGTSAAFADVDGDGKLDLFVGNYVRFDPSSQQYCKTNGVATSCPPGIYDGVPGRLYRNVGAGRFQDASAPWGLQSSPGKTLGAAFADLDGGGRPSLALANDEVPGELYLHTGTRFENVGARAGIAFSNVGQPQAGMGEDWGDYDGDGRLDLTVMTFATELKPVYRNEGRHLFSDNSSQLGLTAPLTPYVAFGVKWLDADNDGWLDLLITNGHTADNIAETGQGYTYRQPTLFLHNAQGRRFVPLPQPDLDRPIVGRGLAVGDYDNDGRVDALVVDSEGEPLLLHNETPDAGHWLLLRLIGRSGSRDAYGATITVQTATRTLYRHCHADGSYLSSSDPRIHVGLGKEATARKITIRWPRGGTQTVENAASDRVLTIEEGKAPR